MLLRTFKWTDSCPELGEAGWLADIPGFYAVTDGRLGAHDVLEHAPNDDGKPEQELMAIGAIIFGRYNQGLIGFNSYHSPEQNLASDVLSTLTDSGFTVERAPKTRASSELAELLDDYILPVAKETVQRELNAIGNEYPDLTTQDWRNVRAWIVKGYQRAKRVYKSPRVMAKLFTEIERQWPKGGDLGEVLNVHVNITRESVRLERSHDYDTY